MSDALARHDEILRSAIKAGDGYVFKTVGDAFCAAICTAPEALKAAREAQRALLAEILSRKLAITHARALAAMDVCGRVAAKSCPSAWSTGVLFPKEAAVPSSPCPSRRATSRPW